MRRAVAIALLVVAVPVVLIFAAGAGGDGGGDYKVRAIFDNASFLIPGQDVKVAGAKVGVVEDLDIVRKGDRSYAAIIMRIDKDGFKDFRADAKCAIRLQSVIGEKLIECTPTQPRSSGEQPPPPLQKVPDGQPGAGQYLLPVENTVTPVDADLINNIQRRPYRERFSILLNELGTGLAARAEDIQVLVKRANPALREFDEFLKILADQNKDLERLTKNADTVLTAWAKEKESTADFFVKSRIAARVTAEERRDFERNLEKFPPFLRQLGPFMDSFQALSSAMEPVVSDLRVSASDLSRFLVALGPFSRSSTVALKSLGNTADVSRPIIVGAEPVVKQIDAFTSQAKTVASNARRLFTSIQKGGGVERLLDTLYYITLSTNGFDSIGHYLRNNLIVTICSGYALTPTTGCSANFQSASSSSSTSSSAAPRATASGLMDLLGLSGKPKSKTRDNGPKQESASKPDVGPAGGESGGTAKPAPETPADNQRPGVGDVAGDGSDPLVDYLLGGAR
jgi:phospholipid/cholesterol/gamma-HCH transport system substrate-binding protein